MAFWSAARLLLICFFCRTHMSATNHKSHYRDPSYLGLLSLLEESILARLLLSLVGGEVLGLGDLINLLLVEAGDVDLVGGGDDVSGVHSSQRNAVNLEGSGDEENTLVESLQEDDSLSSEAASEEDEDGTGLEGLARSPRSDSLANL